MCTSQASPELLCSYASNPLLFSPNIPLPTCFQSHLVLPFLSDDDIVSMPTFWHSIGGQFTSILLVILHALLLVPTTFLQATESRFLSFKDSSSPCSALFFINWTKGVASQVSKLEPSTLAMSSYLSAASATLAHSTSSFQSSIANSHAHHPRFLIKHA